MSDMFNVFPLFSSPVATAIVKEDMSNLRNITDLSYNTTNIAGSQVTKTFALLDSFEEEKHILNSYFYQYINNTLQIGNTSFAMISSWGTKCLKGCGSDYHNHKNSYISAVFYLDNVVDGGELIFSDVGLKPTSFLINRSERPNQFNSDLFFLKPEKNMIVFFPSYLMHKVGVYMGEQDRYSIAMNFAPTGTYGESDSRITALSSAG